MSLSKNGVSDKNKSRLNERNDELLAKGKTGSCRESNPLEKYRSMGNSHFASHFRNNDSTLSTTTSTLLAVATLFALLPSTFAILVPPPFIPQLQHHRPFPTLSNPIRRLNSLGDLSIPFGYRQ